GPPLPPLVHKTLYWLLLALPISLRLLGMLAQFAFSKMRPSSKKQQLQREKSTTQTIKTLLSELKKNPNTASFSQLGKNFSTFLELKLEASTQGLTQEQLNSKMQEKGLPNTLREHVLYILSECDSVQFGHSPPHPQVCTAILHVLKEWP
ncbi:MAG: hypothetical protein FWC28_00700, partial [Proteobacteria bacterium]|nr:hypothetical protein [Pseudomonadota bacterium]